MLESIVDAIASIVLAIASESQPFVEFEHVGDPARYIAMDPETRIVFSNVVVRGSIRIPRDFRLLIEPLAVMTNGQIVERIRVSSVTTGSPWVTQ